MPKKIKKEEPEQLSRENLIVPEEIFAEELSEEAEESLQEAPECAEDAEGAEDEACGFENGSPALDEEDGAPEQIAFFDEEGEPSDEQTVEEAYPDDLSEDEEGFNPEKPRVIDKIFDVLELMVITVAAVLLLTGIFFRHAIVDGGSMESTLYDSEHLIISDLFYTAEVGDVVVFEYHSLPESLRKPIVKRVIAKGGDTVRIDSEGTVFVNGKEIEDEHKHLEGGRYYNLPEYKYAAGVEYKVSEGCIFVLGDNRNNSTDSRYFGEIPEDAVLGKVILRIYPFDAFGKVDKEDG